MFSLPLSLCAAQQSLNRGSFDHALFKKAVEPVFKDEIKTINANLLPLQQGLQYSSYANTDELSTAIIKCVINADEIQIKAYLFYSGIIAGCSCSDDPTPLDVVNEQCEALFTINRSTAETRVSLI